MSTSEVTYDLSLLKQSEQTWANSSGLRAVYADLYKTIHDACKDGESLELGSGIGVSKDYIPNVITSDINKTPYVDCAMSAYEITLSPSGPWANIFALDVLHHLRFPLRFLQSAANALRPGGRIILMEPAATIGGVCFYRSFHQEPIIRNQLSPPYEFEPNGPDGEFANMAMGVSLFRDHLPQTNEWLNNTGLKITQLSYRDLFAYPLTGGYSKPQLLPTPLIQKVLSAEQKIPQCILKQFALRMFIVLEKHH